MLRNCLAVLLLLTAHISVAKEVEIRTDLRVLQFNSVAEQYLDRQTVVTVRGKPGKQELMVRFVPYGSSVSGLNEPWFLFRASSADEYLAHIAKYRDWAARATENGDAFSKDIGKAKAAPGTTQKFGFHSGNAKTHYLVVTLCSLGNCAVQEPMYLNRQGADELFSLITKLKTGELPGEDVGAKYN